ncbi:MAG: tripartite tricarboxylate transporter substrate-binding protein, partial [Vulcanimicrobiaceae bacterium]
TIRDLLSAAKTTPITVAGFGSQSAEALFLRQLASESGAKLTWVPFGGGAAATPAVLGGHVVAALNHPGDVKSFVETGKLRVLAGSDASATRLFPGAVTFQSLGYPDLTVLHYRGVIAKAGTPPDVIAALNRFFSSVSRDPEFVAYMKNVNVSPYLRDSGAFTKMVTSDLDSMQKQLQSH